jgi:soluble lytic murein transglycosylase-like protein/tetratricopeptide (TPR) repeat protein
MTWVPMASSQYSISKEQNPTPPNRFSLGALRQPHPTRTGARNHWTHHIKRFRNRQHICGYPVLFSQLMLIGFGSALSPSISAATKVQVMDPHHAVREAIHAQDPEAAKAHLDTPAEIEQYKGPVPGLFGKVLELEGQPEKACSIYVRLATQDSIIAKAALLRAADCTGTLGQTETAIQLWERVITTEPWKTIPEVSLMAWTHLKSTQARERTLKHFAEVYLTKAKSFQSSSSQRENRAKLIKLIILEGPKSAHETALKALYTTYADTTSAAALFEKKNAKNRFARTWAKKQPLQMAVARARTLVQQHRNRLVFKTLQPFRPAPSDVSESACEIRFLIGKTARKIRKYKTARRDLDFVSESCTEPWKRKALYLAARVASYQNNKDTLKVLNRFLKIYPSSAFSDDVMVWKAEYYSRRHQYLEAEKIFGQAFRSFPKGDMGFHAGFQEAFLPAFRGEIDISRKRMEDLIRVYQDRRLQAAREKKSTYVFEMDQLHYWRARFLAFPDIRALTLESDPQKVALGMEGFMTLSHERPASYYGHLAALNLAAIRESGAMEGAASIEEKPPLNQMIETRHQLGKEGTLVAGPALTQQNDFHTAVAFLEAGFDAESVLFLDQVGIQKRSSADRTMLSFLFARANRPDRAHQVMRFSGNALPPKSPYKEDLLEWTLSFPRAHSESIAQAASQAGFASTLLQGLAREESAFQASVKSWAGAIGLCQLMPATAKEEAGLAKVQVDHAFYTRLLEPSLNATLGANHLSRRIKMLKHPLLGIAAYNAGPGNVYRWRKQKPIQPVDAFVESIPVEQTRNYVKKVTGSWVTYGYLDPGEELAQFSLVLP